MGYAMTTATRHAEKLQQLVYWLEDWAEWRRGYRPPTGYGNGSPGFGSGYTTHFDDLLERAEQAALVATETAIEDLPPAQLAAVQRRYCGISVWRLVRPNYTYEDALRDAHQTLLRVLPAKGVVL
jgi:hypothetical protein